MKTTALSAALAIAFLGMMAVAPEAAAQTVHQRYELKIPRQSLDEALKALARQTGLQVASFSDTVDGRVLVGPVEGVLTPAQALEVLLGGQNLGYKFPNERTISVGWQGHSEPVAFNIAAQPLDTALNAFAAQSGVRVSYEQGAVRHVTANAVVGNFEKREALEKLVQGAGIEVIFSEDGAATIIAKPNKGASSGLAQEQVRLAEASEVQETERKSPELRRSREISSKTSSEVTEMDTILVTGTLIRGITPDSSPIAVYKKEDIERMGAFTAGDLMRNIPQNFALIDGETTLNSGGNPQARSNTSRNSGVNLRGLGAGSTLTLVNGLRLAPGGADGSIIDISMIPLSAIDRVDVLTDGASAIYGSDAVAGVVNFTLQRDFTGAETTVRFGSTTRGGDTQRGISQLYGTSWTSGNVLVAYDKQDAAGLRTNQRDFIPDVLGGGLQILPIQDRQTGFISARQSLGDSLELVATGLYGRRNFEQDVTLFVPSHTTGTARQSMGALGLRAFLPADWQMESTAQFAETRESQVIRAFIDPTFTFTSLAGMHSKLASIDLRADGPIATLPSGLVRLSTGAALRREQFDDESLSAIVSQGSNLKRTVTSVFGEVFVPIIGPGSSKLPIHRLELSLAGRYENYDDLGSSANPKIGLLLAPSESFTLRTTYATSFRAPPLAQLGSSELYFVYLLDDPASPTGQTNTLVKGTPGNPDLRPERARSFTVGFDFKPTSVPEFAASATYYNVRYRDRIALPPILGSIFNIYSQTDTLAPFLDRTPDPQMLQQIYDEIGYMPGTYPLPPTPPTPADIQAYFDNSQQNIALMRASGLEASITYNMDTRIGRIAAFLSGDYRFKLENTPASTTPTVDLINTIYNPMDLRVRAGMDLSWGGATAALTLNYSDGYKNNLTTPITNVASWSTIDFQISYRAPDSVVPFVRGTILRVMAQNLLDRNPPFVTNPANQATDYKFDGTNASPRGRFIALSLTKVW